MKIIIDKEWEIYIKDQKTNASRLYESKLLDELAGELIGNETKLKRDASSYSSMVKVLFDRKNTHADSADFNNSKIEHQPELAPGIHSRLLAEACRRINVYQSNEYQAVVDFLIGCIGNAKDVGDWYKDFYENGWGGENTNSLKILLSKFEKLLNEACSNGQAELVEGMKWWADYEINTAKNGNNYVRETWLNRVPNSIYTMTRESSCTPYEGIIRTIEAMEKIGYDIMTFESLNSIKDLYGVRRKTPGLLHKIASGASQEDRNALSVMAYFVDRGMNPDLQDEKGKTPIQLLKNKATRIEFQTLLESIKSKKTALSILDEMGIFDTEMSFKSSSPKI